MAFAQTMTGMPTAAVASPAAAPARRSAQRCRAGPRPATIASAMPPHVVNLCVSSIPRGRRIGNVPARDAAGSGRRRAPRVRTNAIADRSNAAASSPDTDTADGVNATEESDPESDSTSTSTSTSDSSSLVDDILATIANTDSGRLVKAGFTPISHSAPAYRS